MVWLHCFVQNVCLLMLLALGSVLYFFSWGSDSHLYNFRWDSRGGFGQRKHTCEWKRFAFSFNVLFVSSFLCMLRHMLWEPLKCHSWKWEIKYLRLVQLFCVFSTAVSKSSLHPYTGYQTAFKLSYLICHQFVVLINKLVSYDKKFCISNVFYEFGDVLWRQVCLTVKR